MKATIHIVPHTHWDREWYFTVEEFRYRLVKMFDRLLTLMENGTIEYFVMDGQIIILKDYLEIRPENEQRFRKLIEDGRLIVGPWYTQPNLFMCSAESQVRNLLRGRDEMNDLGAEFTDINYLPDQFGFTSQLPQMLEGFGMTHLVGARGLPMGCPNYFLWEGSDGTVTRVCSLWHSYHNANGFCDREEPLDFTVFGAQIHMPSLPERLDVVLMESERAVAPHLLAMNGVDHMYPNPSMKSTIAKIKELHPEVEVVQSNFHKYIDAVNQTIEKELITYKGEHRDPREDYILTASQSMRMDIKKYNRKMEDMLERRVEPLMVRMVGIGELVPTAMLKHAWDYMLQNQSHDSHCCANSEPSYREIYSRFERADDVSREIATELEQRFIRRIAALPQEALVIFNPSTSVRDEVLTLDIIVPKDTTTHPHLFADGQELPVYVQSVRDDMLLRFVPFSGWVGQLAVKIFTVTVQTGAVMPTGYKTLEIKQGNLQPKPVEGIVSSHTTMENERLIVSVNPDATLNVTDKTTGRSYTQIHRFIDDGEKGCGFMHLSPTGDYVSVSAGRNIDICVMENSPIKGVLRIRQSMAVPSGLANGMESRSDHTEMLEITTNVILRKDSGFVEFETVIDNTACDHRLRISFPTDLQCDICYAGQPYDVVMRPIQPENVNYLAPGTYEPYYGHQPMHDFCGISDGKIGAAFTGDGIMEYEVLPMRRTVCLTLIRATDRLHVGVLGAGSKFKLPKAQLLGKQSYRYAFIPHSGSYENVLTDIERFRHPMYSVQKDFLEEESMPDYERPQQNMPTQGGFVEVEGAVLTTAIKPAEDGNGFILRIYNPSSSQEKARIKLYPAYTIAKVEQCRLDEVFVRDVIAIDNCFTAETMPKKILSFRIILK